MTVVETLLVFLGVPLAVIVVLALLTFVPGRQKRARYRSGQPWEHAPIWYEPQPEHPEDAGHGAGHGDAHAALPAGGAPAITSGSSAPAPTVGGPLGGARGTW